MLIVTAACFRNFAPLNEIALAHARASLSAKLNASSWKWQLTAIDPVERRVSARFSLPAGVTQWVRTLRVRLHILQAPCQRCSS